MNVASAAPAAGPRLDLTAWTLAGFGLALVVGLPSVAAWLLMVQP